MIYITRFARRNEDLRSSFEVISTSMQTKIYKVYRNIVDSYRDIYSLAMFKTFNEMNVKKKQKSIHRIKSFKRFDILQIF